MQGGSYWFEHLINLPLQDLIYWLQRLVQLLLHFLLELLLQLVNDWLNRLRYPLVQSIAEIFACHMLSGSARTPRYALMLTSIPLIVPLLII